jgi:hypothetical protein
MAQQIVNIETLVVLMGSVQIHPALVAELLVNLN